MQNSFGIKCPKISCENDCLFNTELSSDNTQILIFIYDGRIEIKMKSKTKTLGKLLRFAVEVCSGKHLGVGISCEMRLLFHHQIKSIHYMWVIESIVEEKSVYLLFTNKDF